MLKHGGNLREAAQQYGMALEHWLDLSTGINPQHYPMLQIDTDAWQRLPEEGDGLQEAACAYYGCESVLPTAGSQAAIQILPQLMRKSRVAMPRNMYKEHAHAWQQHGHVVTLIDAAPSEAQVKQLDVLLLCNPNNPTGQRYVKSQLHAWHQMLAANNGCLIIDEAFMDVTPEESMAQYSHLKGLIILRSLGKFFGLAGARVGFLLAHPALLNQAKNLLGPWAVAGPSRVIAKKALQDKSWQANTRQALGLNSQRLSDLLSQHGLSPSNGTALFQYVMHAQAKVIQHQLAQHGVWIRTFESPAALRLGLPADDAGFAKLETSLQHLL